MSQCDDWITLPQRWFRWHWCTAGLWTSPALPYTTKTLFIRWRKGMHQRWLGQPNPGRSSNYWSTWQLLN